MNKQEIYEFLRIRNIAFEVTEHPAVFNMNEIEKIELPFPEAEAKNLFVRDDKKNNYYLITVKGNKRVDLKNFRKENGTRPLTFASENDLFHLTNLTPGSVTPLGILNDQERKIGFYLDEDFLGEECLIGVHPNDNTATVWLKTTDLIKIIKDHGNSVKTVKL